MIHGSISAAISIILQLLSLSIAQCTLDQAKEIWKDFFDRSTERHGTKIFDQLLIVYENRLNTESNDTLKLTVSNMIKSLLNISSTAKEEAVTSKAGCDVSSRKDDLPCRRIDRIANRSFETSSNQVNSLFTSIGSMCQQSKRDSLKDIDVSLLSFQG